MAQGDLFRLVLFAELFGQDVQNVFHYRQAGSTIAVPAVNLLSAWQANVLPSIANMQCADITYQRILVQNLGTPADNAEDLTPTPAVGGLALPCSPSFVAMAFRSNRPDLSQRYSWKRFAAGPQSRTVGQSWTAEQLAAMATAANAMELILGAPAGYSFTPAQVGNDAPAGQPPDWQWRYDITQWVEQGIISTQDTRKIGRGD